MFRNRTVPVGVLFVCLFGIALCAAGGVPAATASPTPTETATDHQTSTAFQTQTETATASPAPEQVREESGFVFPRWLVVLVVLLGSLVPVGYVGSKGYRILANSKR